MMSSILNKASALGAIILLMIAFAISVSPQTPVAVSNLTVTDSLRETSETTMEKRSVPPAKGTDSTTEREKVSEISPRSEVSDAVSAHNGTKVSARGANASPQTASSDEWQFQFTPYLWIASISGRAGIGNLILDTQTSVTNSGVELNFGFMSTFEARRNRFIVLADVQYSDLSTEKGNPGPLFSSTRGSFKTFVLDPEVGYRLLDNGKGASLDVLGGIRYWHLNGTLAFSAGILPAVEVSRSRSWVDGVVGLRGKAALSERWFVTGKADLGGGGSNFTYQLFGGVGFNVGQRLALIGGYRDLNVNYNKDGFLFDMSLHGPVLGLGFKF